MVGAHRRCVAVVAAGAHVAHPRAVNRQVALRRRAHTGLPGRGLRLLPRHGGAARAAGEAWGWPRRRRRQRPRRQAVAAAAGMAGSLLSPHDVLELSANLDHFAGRHRAPAARSTSPLAGWRGWLACQLLITPLETRDSARRVPRRAASRELQALLSRTLWAAPAVARCLKSSRDMSRRADRACRAANDPPTTAPPPRRRHGGAPGGSSGGKPMAVVCLPFHGSGCAGMEVERAAKAEHTSAAEGAVHTGGAPAARVERSPSGTAWMQDFECQDCCQAWEGQRLHECVHVWLVGTHATPSHSSRQMMKAARRALGRRQRGGEQNVGRRRACMTSTHLAHHLDLAAARRGCRDHSGQQGKAAFRCMSLA